MKIHLVSHRFSTVRHADQICVIEHGRVIEFGSHQELMALGGRYRTMFDLQASRFDQDQQPDDQQRDDQEADDQEATDQEAGAAR